MVMHAEVRKADERTFNSIYEKRVTAIIDAVTRELQALEPRDFQEAGSTTIRERSKKAINEVLGAPLVQRVLVTERNYSKQ
jgi:hypothetical protein